MFLWSNKRVWSNVQRRSKYSLVLVEIGGGEEQTYFILGLRFITCVRTKILVLYCFFREGKVLMENLAPEKVCGHTVESHCILTLLDGQTALLTVRSTHSYRSHTTSSVQDSYVGWAENGMKIN